VTLQLLAFGSSTADAQETHPRIELRWQAPAECPSDLALLRAIEGFLGQPLAQAREQQLSIDAHVQGDTAHGYAVQVSFATTTGTTERSMEHAECEKLTQATALLMALAIDPERVRAHQQAPASAESAEAEPATAPLPQAPPDRPEPLPPLLAPVVPLRAADPSPLPAKREQALHVSLGVLGLAADGTLPGVAPGLGLELGFRVGWLEAALGGRSWLSRSAAVPGEPAVGVDVSATTASLRLCGVPARGQWSLLACARGDWGSMTGQGQQVDNARTRHDRFAGLGGSLAVAYAVGRFSPRAGAELMWSVARPRFGILRDGREVEAFRPEPRQLAGFIGLSYEL
jgi:hypothetical protein